MRPFSPPFVVLGHIIRQLDERAIEGCERLRYRGHACHNPAMTHLMSVSGESRSAAIVSQQRGAGRRTFKIVLIKPSHYDADGYVIQWWRSTIPSNSLASVYGLLAECAEDKTLGPDVDIDIDAFDECNTVIDVKATIR